MKYQPTQLQRWTLPSSYAGAQWPEWFVFLGQNRDSNALTRSNFTCGLKRVGGETETVRVIRESHWAVGWVEWIGIHESDAEALAKADALARKLDGYPVVNEDHWSELEFDEALEFWGHCSIPDRVAICADKGESIFAARRDCPPNRVLDSLRDGQ